jgi:hypothetical protein
MEAIMTISLWYTLSGVEPSSLAEIIRLARRAAVMTKALIRSSQLRAKSMFLRNDRSIKKQISRRYLHWTMITAARSSCRL